jgi:hypothetical protein
MTRGIVPGVVITRTLEVGSMRAAAHSRPAFYDPREKLLVNVDNLFLGAASVANEPAIAVAIAHGNYKDNACAIASEVAMRAAEAELAVDFLGEADVGPALQRALLTADDRIRERAEGPLPKDKDLLGTCMGVRKTLKGIGASMMAAVVTSRHVFIAHAGECRAWLVDGGGQKALTRAHTLAMTAEARAEIAKDPSQKELFESVVIHLVGFDGVVPELTRAPFPPGARLVIGNPALVYTTDFSGPPAEAVVRIADALSAHRDASYCPATLAIIERG